jgi:hypothetical protein
MSRKLLSVAFALVMLALGMRFFVGVTGSKFGTLSGGRDGHELRQNLRALAVHLNAHHAAFDGWWLVEPYPPDRARADDRAPWPADHPFAGLGWTKAPSSRGQFWVEAGPGAGFTAHGVQGALHYVVRRDGEPVPASP